jgi:hypothetical protein
MRDESLNKFLPPFCKVHTSVLLLMVSINAVECLMEGRYSKAWSISQIKLQIS